MSMYMSGYIPHAVMHGLHGLGGLGRSPTSASQCPPQWQAHRSQAPNPQAVLQHDFLWGASLTKSDSSACPQSRHLVHVPAPCCYFGLLVHLWPPVDCVLLMWMYTKSGGFKLIHLFSTYLEGARWMSGDGLVAGDQNSPVWRVHRKDS